MANYGSIFGGAKNYGQQQSASGDDGALGSGIGGSVGGALGSVIPGIGTLFGGLIGSTLGKLMSGADDPSPWDQEQAKKKAEHEQWLKNVSNMKLGMQPMQVAPQVQSAQAAPQVAQQTNIPGLDDPEYYQKLAQQKYRSAMGG